MTRVEESHGIRSSGQVADTSSVNDLLATLPAYTPALAYLLLVCGFLAASGTCPTWVHPVAVVVGVPARVRARARAQVIVRPEGQGGEGEEQGFHRAGDGVGGRGRVG